MGYENAAQFDRAAKRSIKNTGKDPGIAYFDRVEVLRPGIVQSGSRQCLMEPRKYRMGFLSVIYHSGQDTPLYLLALSAASKMRSALAKMRASSPTVMS